ncbi:MAG TPA: enoyl-CoA hydratase-related protein [Xanthobacteraceae bacterium]|nr:enoyl-CoA hydratase-related protein [Xanthobacteraceae bacterium]
MWQGCRFPVVMALNGVVAGGAIGLALTGDYIVAADVVRFRTAYAALGLVGDAGVTKLLTEALGVRRARSLMLTNRCFTAVDAASWGMIDEVVSAAQLAGRARELALQFAAGPTAAFRRMKALLAEAADSSYEGQLDRERDEMLEAAHTADVREGIRAFMEKRQPIFVGR